MNNRLKDYSISVREAVVDLIGKFMLSNPEHTQTYYEVVLERLQVSSVWLPLLFLLSRASLS